MTEAIRRPAGRRDRPAPAAQRAGAVIRGHESKQGSRMLRWALVEAIQRQPAGTKAGAAARPDRSPAARHNLRLTTVGLGEQRGWGGRVPAALQILRLGWRLIAWRIRGELQQQST